MPGLHVRDECRCASSLPGYRGQCQPTRCPQLTQYRPEFRIAWHRALTSLTVLHNHTWSLDYRRADTRRYQPRPECCANASRALLARTYLEGPTGLAGPPALLGGLAEDVYPEGGRYPEGYSEAAKK
jgi:hypothetical protein